MPPFSHRSTPFFEVGVEGNFASWMVPGKDVPGKIVEGIGGTIDLMAMAQNMIVILTHTLRNGDSKL